MKTLLCIVKRVCLRNIEKYYICSGWLYMEKQYLQLEQNFNSLEGEFSLNVSIQWCYRFPWQIVSLPSRGMQTCATSDVAIIVESFPKTVGNWVQWMFLILFNPIQEYFDVSLFSLNVYLWKKRMQEWGQITMFNEGNDLKLTLKDWCQSKLGLICFWTFLKDLSYALR